MFNRELSGFPCMVLFGMDEDTYEERDKGFTDIKTHKRNVRIAWIAAY